MFRDSYNCTFHLYFIFLCSYPAPVILVRVLFTFTSFFFVHILPSRLASYSAPLSMLLYIYYYICFSVILALHISFFLHCLFFILTSWLLMPRMPCFRDTFALYGSSLFYCKQFLCSSSHLPYSISPCLFILNYLPLNIQVSGPF